MQPKRALVGAFAGVVATVAMSGWMSVGQRIGRYGDQPPERLVRRMAHRAGLPARRDDPRVETSWVLAHLGFGMACGATYALLVPRSSAVRGMAFGLGVWGASYAGWVPALRLMPPPHRDDPARTVVTATAHLVYGAVLGRVVGSTARDGS